MVRIRHGRRGNAALHHRRDFGRIGIGSVILEGTDQPVETIVSHGEGIERRELGGEGAGERGNFLHQTDCQFGAIEV